MASSEKRLTKKEIIKQHQEACRKMPCTSATNKRITCPFCPHHDKEK